MKSYPLLFAFSLICLAASSSEGASTWDSSVDQTIRDRDFSKAKTMLESELGKALVEPSKKYEILWRLSRVEIFLGDQEKEESKKEALYERSLKYADEATQAASGEAMGYVRKAIASGKLALFKGILGARDYVNAARDQAQKAIDLGGKNQEAIALAHYVLGRTHLKLSDTPQVIRKPIGLGWGNLAEAEKQLNQATELQPDSILFWVEKVKLYKKTKNDTELKKAIEKAKALPVKEPSDQDAKQELEKI